MSIKEGDKSMDRRDFVVGTTAAAALAGAGLAGCSDDADPPGGDGPAVGKEAGMDQGPVPDSGPGKDGGSPTLVGRVAEVTDTKSVPTGVTFDKVRVRAALRAGLLTLTGAADLKAAWKVLLPDFTAATRVGLKVNCISQKLANSPELVGALIETMIQDLGAKASNIIVWDRLAHELKSAGLTAASLGAAVQVLATEPGAGGPGFNATQYPVRSQSTTFSAILTDKTDITFDLGVLKDHDIGGITGAMKNVYGMIHNPGSFHSELPKDLPELFALTPVRKRVRLSIIEGFIAVRQGGPMGPPTDKAGKLLLSTDPVAIDAHALELINGLRKVPIATSSVSWLAAAAAKGLGSNKPTVVKKTMA